MANRQQPLEFDLTDEIEAAEDEWTDDEEDEAPVEWAVEDDDGEDLWHGETPGDEPAEERSMTWDAAAERDGSAPADAHGYAAVFGGTAKRDVTARNRNVGRAVLSAAACLALVWIANHLPKPAAEARHGRDAKLSVEPLASRPEEILRLASTREEADADAQVAVWREHQQTAAASRPVVAETRKVDVADREVVVESRAVPAAVASAAPAEVPTTRQLDLQRPVSKPATRTVETASLKDPKKAPAAAAAKSAAPAAKAVVATSAVYTVQLGAFKTRSNAEEMAQKLQGKPTRIVRDGSLYRVVSGQFQTRGAALAHETALKRAGYPAFVRTATF